MTEPARRAVTAVTERVPEPVKEVIKQVVPQIVPPVVRPAVQILEWGDALLDDFFGYQHGGLAMEPHLARVGEVPEAIIPLDRLPDFMGSGGGGLTMVFQDAVYGFQDFEDRVEEAVLTHTRRRRRLDIQTV